MRALLLIVTATLCFAATESRVSRASILAVEGSVDEALKHPRPIRTNCSAAPAAPTLKGTERCSRLRWI